LAYKPVEAATQWSAVSGSALTITGDVILAPALAKFENFRPSGLRYMGRHEVGPLGSAFMNGRCAAIYALVVDPEPEGEGSGSLCPNGRAAFMAARVDEAGERLSLTVYSDTADPQRGGEPCRALDFVRSV
jgi:GNAT superfamily N-acetyltransferase